MTNSPLGALKLPNDSPSFTQITWILILIRAVLLSFLYSIFIPLLKDND